MTAAVGGLDGSRTIVRRRALPSGRAVTGGFLMALAALGVFVAARGAGQPATQNYVVVAHDGLEALGGQLRCLPDDPVRVLASVTPPSVLGQDSDYDRHRPGVIRPGPEGGVAHDDVALVGERQAVTAHPLTHSALRQRVGGDDAVVDLAPQRRGVLGDRDDLQRHSRAG